jgi:hypothetical protein
LDSGTMMVFLEAPAPRVECGRCGVVVAAVPWARAGARFTHAFEDSCAWLAARAAQSVVCELMRVTWRTVAGIVKRVVADEGAKKGSSGMNVGDRAVWPLVSPCGATVLGWTGRAAICTRSSHPPSNAARAAMTKRSAFGALPS